MMKPAALVPTVPLDPTEPLPSEPSQIRSDHVTTARTRSASHE
jgi:hypothetical protein